MKIFAAIALITSSVIPGIAQVYSGLSELSFSSGFRSFHELAQGGGLAPGGGSDVFYVSKSSGNFFLTYHYFLSGNFSIGCTAGRDQFFVTHESSSSETDHSRYDYTTVALEFLLIYSNHKWMRTYGYLGPGYSSYTERYTEYSNGRGPEVTDHHNAFNLQFVPIGVSVGKSCAAFAELGLGYKGIINCGISYRVGRKKKLPYELLSLDPGDVVVVPGDYPIDDKFVDLTQIRSGVAPAHNATGLEAQLQVAELKVKYNKGNVLQLKKVTNTRRNSEGQSTFHIKGEAYYTPDISALKEDIQQRQQKLFDSGNCAYIIFYRRDNDVHQATVQIDDTIVLKIKNAAAYRYKITRDGPLKVLSGSKNGGTITLDLSIKYGTIYYIKASMERTRHHRSRKRSSRTLPVLYLRDSAQGEVESAAFKHRYNVK